MFELNIYFNTWAVVVALQERAEQVQLLLVVKVMAIVRQVVATKWKSLIGLQEWNYLLSRMKE